jgi:dCMP deaminase
MKQKYITAFVDMAERFGQTSEATRLKVGALIVKDGAIISCGVNGTPTGYHTNLCEGADGKTLGVVRHAEVNALNKLRRSSGTSSGASMFCSHACCLPCAIELVDAGVSKFYYKHEYRDDAGLKYLEANGVQVEWINEDSALDYSD